MGRGAPRSARCGATPGRQRSDSLLLNRGKYRVWGYTMSVAGERVGRRNPKAVNSVLEQIGNTPLLRLVNISKAFDRVEIYGKAEWFNPGGSVKDRPALRMIEEGERSGALTRDKVILDSSSGNTGIAYAWIGAVKGYRVHLAVPRHVSQERSEEHTSELQ